VLKHVRKALEIAGPEGVAVHHGGKHYYLIVNGKRIICSASPKNADHASLRIARDIKRARA
jgi:hypothetical protein